MLFNVKKKLPWNAKYSHNIKIQIKTVERHLDDIFRLKESIFMKNSGANFTLKISTNQRFENFAISHLTENPLSLVFIQ